MGPGGAVQFCFRKFPCGVKCCLVSGRFLYLAEEVYLLAGLQGTANLSVLLKIDLLQGCRYCLKLIYFKGTSKIVASGSRSGREAQPYWGTASIAGPRLCRAVDF
jgi:hypothetical protein